MDMQQCKVFFAVETTREQADKIVLNYAADAKIDTFWAKREIGCNVLTFAVVTLPVQAAAKMHDDRGVLRVEILTTFKGGKGEECCSPSG